MGRILRTIRVRNQVAREFLAEFLGTMILILFGDGVVAQVTLSEGLGMPKGNFFTINWGWGLGVTMAVLIAGGVSGAHINPAVTLAMAVIGKLPWIKMFHYMLAQYLGAFVGAALVHANYYEALVAFETAQGESLIPGTAGIFATYPADYLSNGGGFLDQIIGTALLLMVVCAVGDQRNMKISSQMAPLYVGFTVLAIGVCFGVNCGYAINPARDLGPRLWTLIVHWGTGTFSYGNYWFYVPILAPYLGGIIGAGLYFVCIENNWPEKFG
ncbi:hypothetical protein TCAL_10232 [Tigriopus californicus]|uniref:Aquaporin-3 n=2 Tax=Tigriopus californicus TaxID=6832 RepID=A0A553NSL1_TIGCA|nr:aquaporin-10-like isoform X2 [Tigriopus californicus]TRY68400.1 hypothetical protein TCAL_10232 [Tigriopus californicus]|eukprot:TCALIF_10232-PA protein Name:"Similar to Aqp3 Aquaporin-3 (Mus musculus)" AED:0.03 eAED:0.03 QI:377/1/1/1/0.5/0.66/3/143/269